MLIGQTVTLKTLEHAINEKRIELKKEEQVLYDRAEVLREILRTVKVRIKNEEGQLVTNPEYVESYKEFEKLRIKVELNKSEEVHLREKAKELEKIEDEAKAAGKYFSKEEERITLNLNELVLYGVTQEMIDADNNKKGEV